MSSRYMSYCEECAVLVTEILPHEPSRQWQHMTVIGPAIYLEKRP
jgi:hypothetical protein